MFTKTQVVRHIEKQQDYTIELCGNVMMRTCNGDWTAAYVYHNADTDTYYVRDRSDMEDKFEAVSK